MVSLRIIHTPKAKTAKNIKIKCVFGIVASEPYFMSTLAVTLSPHGYLHILCYHGNHYFRIDIFFVLKLVLNFFRPFWAR